MVKTIKKILVATLIMSLLMTAIIYETYSIMRKEYERQVEIANLVRENVTLDLNMVKIAVQTNDEEVYSNNLVKMEAEIKRIDELSMLDNSLAGYKTRLKYYADLLEAKKDLLPEIKALKTKIDEIVKVLKENFVSTTVTRDKLREVNPKMVSLMIDVNNYTNENVKTVATAVNSILNDLATYGTTLSDCIDTCYKNRITEVTNGVNDLIKGFSDKTAGLNLAVENEFQLEVLGDLL